MFSKIPEAIGFNTFHEISTMKFEYKFSLGSLNLKDVNVLFIKNGFIVFWRENIQVKILDICRRTIYVKIVFTKLCFFDSQI